MNPNVIGAENGCTIEMPKHEVKLIKSTPCSGIRWPRLIPVFIPIYLIPRKILFALIFGIISK